MRSLYRKLASERGISSLFAMFLLVVCICVGSIVLVSGTVSAGRVSQLANNDSRYYAVSSAADLLRESIEGNEITVRMTHNTIKEKETQYNKEVDGWKDYVAVAEHEISDAMYGTKGTNNGKSYNYTKYKKYSGTFLVNGVETVNDTLLLTAAARFIGGEEKDTWKDWDTGEVAKWKDFFESPFHELSGDGLQYTIQLENANTDSTKDLTEEELENLSVSVKMTISADGTMVLEIVQDEANASGKYYGIQMTFACVITQPPKDVKERKTSSVYNASSTAYLQKDVKITTEEKIIKIKWEYQGMKVVEKWNEAQAAAATSGVAG